MRRPRKRRSDVTSSGSARQSYVNALCVALLVLAAFGVTAWHLRDPAHSLQDDGYYYLQIARNIASGAGSTFDGVNPTNGYQPLWLVLLLPACASAGCAGTALNYIILLQGAAFAAMLLLVWMTARLSTKWMASLFAAFAWLFLMAQESFKGMEFAIHAVCLGILGYIYLRWFSEELPAHPAPFLSLGIACALGFLARVETLPLAVLVGIVLAWRGVRACTNVRGNLIAFGLPVVLTVGGYALLNSILFGQILPISGVVKRDWSGLLLLADPVYLERGWLAAKLSNFFWSLRDRPFAFPLYLVSGTFGIAGLWLAQALKLGPPRGTAWLERTLKPMTPFVLYSVVNYASFAFLFHGILSAAPWYYVVQPWLTVLFAAFLFDLLSGIGLAGHARIRLVARSAVWILLLLPPVLTARSLWSIQVEAANGGQVDPLYQGALWAQAQLPAAAVIGAWNAGTIGYLSERRTVNLDGVVNSFHFHEQERFDLCGYWRQQGITYLIDAFQGDRALSVLPTRQAYAACAQSLHPIWADTHFNAGWRLQVYEIESP